MLWLKVVFYKLSSQDGRQAFKDNDNNNGRQKLQGHISNSLQSLVCWTSSTLIHRSALDSYIICRKWSPPPFRCYNYLGLLSSATVTKVEKCLKLHNTSWINGPPQHYSWTVITSYRAFIGEQESNFTSTSFSPALIFTQRRCTGVSKLGHFL